MVMVKTSAMLNEMHLLIFIFTMAIATLVIAATRGMVFAFPD
jgi:hypothetical protein